MSTTQRLLPIIVWHPMSTAPRDATWFIAQTRDRTSYRVHYGCGDGDGLMPPFDGFFRAIESGGKVLYYQQVERLIEWRPE